MDDMKNFAYGTVATAPTPNTSGETFVLQTGQGATFPTAPFNATMWPPDVLPRIFNAEIGRCTAVVGDTLTITRAQSGTSAQPIFAGFQICQRVEELYSQALSAMRQYTGREDETFEDDEGVDDYG